MKEFDLFLQGRIIKGIGGFYYIKADDGITYECKARGLFRKERIKPVIGDMVEIETKNGQGNIIKIYERKNELIRPAVSNTDILAVVIAAKDPVPDLFVCDKLIISAEARNIEPVICINKTDIASGESIREIYKNTGYKIFEISAAKKCGIDSLKEYISGKTTAFAGLSGVGKSTTLSLIVGDDLQTGDISGRISRGKHTTRHVELFDIGDGGYVFDTPGFSSFEHEYIKPAELWRCFPEMLSYAASCRFKGCSHINEPGCAVKEAVIRKDISPERYESYKRIYEALKQIKEWEIF